MGALTWEQKVAAYRAGHYRFPVPPVCHAQWTEAHWIGYIDRFGLWEVA